MNFKCHASNKKDTLKNHPFNTYTEFSGKLTSLTT